MLLLICRTKATEVFVHHFNFKPLSLIMRRGKCDYCAVACLLSNFPANAGMRVPEQHRLRQSHLQTLSPLKSSREAENAAKTTILLTFLHH